MYLLALGEGGVAVEGPGEIYSLMAGDHWTNRPPPQVFDLSNEQSLLFTSSLPFLYKLPDSETFLRPKARLIIINGFFLFLFLSYAHVKLAPEGRGGAGSYYIDLSFSARDKFVEWPLWGGN